MPLQSINAVNSDCDITLGGNIITGSLGISDAVTTGIESIGSSLTSGNLNIGTSSSMSGGISIGNETNTGGISVRTSGYTRLYNLNFPDKLATNQAGSATSAVTNNNKVGRITTVVLTDGFGTHRTFTVNNSKCRSTDIIVGNAFVQPGTNIPININFINITDGSFDIRYYLPRGINNGFIRIQFILL